MTKYTIILQEIIDNDSENIKYAGLYSERLLQSNNVMNIYVSPIYTSIKKILPFIIYGNLNNSL